METIQCSQTYFCFDRKEGCQLKMRFPIETLSLEMINENAIYLP